MTRRLFKKLQLSVSRKSRRQEKATSSVSSPSPETVPSIPHDVANGEASLSSLGRGKLRVFCAANNDITGNAADGSPEHLQILDVWKQAPVLKGSTSFEPLPDVNNIMVTGGAGFM